MQMSVVFENMRHLARAGANVLHLVSFEWERIQGYAIGLADTLHAPLHVWSRSSGLERRDATGKRETEDPSQIDPLEILKAIHAAEQPGVWLLEDIHPYLAPEHHEMVRWVREICRCPETPRKVVLLATTQPSLHEDLRKEVPTIEIPLPDVADLRTVCIGVAEALGVPKDDECDALLEGARGLTVMEAKLAFGQAAAKLGRLGPNAVRIVVREKERIIRQSGVLEHYEAQEEWDDIGGLDVLKTWLDRRGRAFGQGAREYGLDAPKGALLLGVQGCGKSLIAKAVAASWRFPLLRFDLGKVYAGIVGQSEANIRTALQVAQALAPCVLWIDEMEKGLAGVESSDRTDSGTAARVFGTLLTWMQEKREPVFVVATANRVDMLPPELLRKGRFDEIFFVDLPTRAVRTKILAIHIHKRKRDPGEFDLAKLSEMSAGFSGAELEEAVREAMFDAFAEGCEISTKHVERAIRSTYPLSRTMRGPIEDLRRWAKARARLASSEPAESLPEGESADVPRLKQEMRNPFIPGGS